MSNHPLISQSLEICIVRDKLFVRIDLGQQNITTGFKEWFSWNVDTRQQQVSSNIIHFIEPGGQIVGIKNFAVVEVVDDE